jgi:hypothetical protein
VNLKQIKISRKRAKNFLFIFILFSFLSFSNNHKKLLGLENSTNFTSKVQFSEADASCTRYILFLGVHVQRTKKRAKNPLRLSHFLSVRLENFLTLSKISTILEKHNKYTEEAPAQKMSAYTIKFFKARRSQH